MVLVMVSDGFSDSFRTGFSGFSNNFSNGFSGFSDVLVMVSDDFHDGS